VVQVQHRFGVSGWTITLEREDIWPRYLAHSNTAISHCRGRSLHYSHTIGRSQWTAAV